MQAYMDFMMKILYFISDLRNPVFDFIFSLITHIGEETVFLVVAIFIFWCVSKRGGYYVLITGLVGTVMNQALKLMFRIPRPWVYDTSFEPVGSAIEEATGYSFPSGHTQNVAGTFGCIARYSKSRPVRVFSIVIIVLVAFSRMYLGVHTLLDVLVSLVLGAVLVFALYPLFSSEERFDKFMPYVSVAATLISLALVLYVFLMSPAGVDEANLYSGMKNASTLFGCTLALIPVYFIDRKYIRFETKGAWYAQAIKLVLGLAIVLGIKAGLSSPLVALFGNEFVARGVRYFLIVMFAGTLWPLTFGFFSTLRIGVLDRLTDKVKAVFSKAK